ncbi:MAG TPA: inosine/xanthosine triphosphatase [Methanocella sp.]|nr:inosine/xanthosine triphosphatase [Methanocella sp.]
MKVAVGTTNPVKVDAVRNVFGRLYDDVVVEGRKVGSGVPDQPVGIETIQGAINRASHAYRIGEYDYGVGIEAGLTDVEGYTLDVQFCAVADRETITIGCGSGFQYPPVVIAGVLAGREVGDVMSDLTGIEDIGKKTGAIGYLSHGMLNRTQLTEQSVLMALIPRINPKLYRKP